MKIGLVHRVQHVGDKIRTDAIRKFLVQRKHHIIDIEINTLAKRSKNPVSYFSWANFTGISKILVSGMHYEQHLNEIIWNDQVRRAKKAIKKNARILLDLANKVDVLHAETHLAAAVCSRIKQITGIRYVFDMHGLVSHEAKGAHTSVNWVKFLEKIESETVKSADYVVVVSNLMRTYISAKYKKPLKQIFVIPNGSELYPQKASYALPLKIIYAGNFAYFERVLDFVKTSEFSRSEEYRFFLMGDGVLRKEIFDYINTNHTNVVYLGKKSKEETLQRFCGMQIGVAPSTKDMARRVASPMKILDYAACGLPIISVNAGEWSDMINKYDCGIVTKNSDPAEFADAIEYLKDEKVWIQKSNNARIMVREEYLWDKVLEPFVEIYEMIPRFTP